MATSIANLAVILSANTKNYSSGLGRAGRDTKTFGSSVRRSLGGVQSAIAKLGVAFTIGGGIALFTRQLQRLDEVAKTSSLLGIATEELTRMQFAAEQTGVSVSTFNMAMQRMTRRVAEAANGTGEAVGALNELGLDPEALNEMGSADAFKAIADAMEGVENQSDRVRLAMKLFDSEGVKLVNTMRGGSAAIEEFGRQSDALGRTVSDDTAAAAVKFNDALNEMKSALGGVVADLVPVLVPALKVTVGALTEVLKVIQRIVEWLQDNQWVVVLSGGLLGTATAIAAIYEELGLASEKTQSSLVDTAGAVEEVTAEIDAASNSLARMQSRAEAIFNATRTPAERLQMKLEEIQALAEQGLIDDDTAARAIEQARSEIETTTRTIDREFERLQDRAAQIFEDAMTPAERLAEQVKDIHDLTSMGLLTPEIARRAIEALQPEVDGIAASVVQRPDTRRVDFAALGAQGAAGRGQDRLQRLAEDEVDESREQNRNLAELIRVTRDRSSPAFVVEF